MPDFSLQRFEDLCGKKVHLVSRRELEEENGSAILKPPNWEKLCSLSQAIPLSPQPMSLLRIDAEKQGVKTRIVHGASIISAIVSLSGLHNYKFGKTVTVPFPENFSATPYNVIVQNKRVGLHTLCLLDLKATEKKFLTLKKP